MECKTACIDMSHVKLFDTIASVLLRRNCVLRHGLKVFFLCVMLQVTHSQLLHIRGYTSRTEGYRCPQPEHARQHSHCTLRQKHCHAFNPSSHRHRLNARFTTIRFRTGGSYLQRTIPWEYTISTRIKTLAT